MATTQEDCEGAATGSAAQREALLRSLLEQWLTATGVIAEGTD